MVMTDQELLRDHVHGKSGAFRELLERHAGLVFGVAARVTGDRSVAEEVAQDVFCLLARKAPALTGHPSLAGWLHRSATNTARAVARQHRRHERKLARFALELTEPSPSVAPDWEKIDAAIDRLPFDERTVIVLRFFEGQDYGPISAALGISETAARQRLSRALRRLQRFLGPPQAASLALAPAALNATAPPDLATAILSQLPAPVSTGGIFTTLTLMTQKQITGTATAVLLSGGLLWFGAAERQKNHRLSAEIATLRDEIASARQKAAAVASPAEAAPPAASPTAEVAALQAELAAERDKRLAAEREAQAVRDQTASLQDQVVVAYGKVSEIGTTLGSVFKEARDLVELDKQGQLDTPEGQTKMAKFLTKASSISGLSQEIIGFEDNPAEGSQFIASTFGAVFDLDQPGREKIAQFFTDQLRAAKEKELTLSHLPEHGSAEFQPWLQKRWDFFNESRGQLRELLPTDQRASFDQWVEKGGYGFKNLTLKGAPLMFSMGGDPR